MKIKPVQVLVILIVLFAGWYAYHVQNTGTTSDVLQPYVASQCRIGGCSSQLCEDKNNPSSGTTCEWRKEYACYRYSFARCEVQQNTGKCGWTPSIRLKACLE